MHCYLVDIFEINCENQFEIVLQLKICIERINVQRFIIPSNSNISLSFIYLICLIVIIILNINFRSFYLPVTLSIDKEYKVRYSEGANTIHVDVEPATQLFLQT
jgi:hypothetical protein